MVANSGERGQKATKRAGLTNKGIVYHSEKGYIIYYKEILPGLMFTLFFNPHFVDTT